MVSAYKKGERFRILEISRSELISNETDSSKIGTMHLQKLCFLNDAFEKIFTYFSIIYEHI